MSKKLFILYMVWVNNGIFLFVPFKITLEVGIPKINQILQNRLERLPTGKNRFIWQKNVIKNL